MRGYTATIMVRWRADEAMSLYPIDILRLSCVINRLTILL